MYNKDIYQLLKYGKFLKKELLELYFDLENNDNYKNTTSIKNVINDIKEELDRLNSILKRIDNFTPEEFLGFSTKYLNQLGNNYIYSRITMYDPNNYSVKNHYFISDDITSKYLNENINCIYDFNLLENSHILDNTIHFEDSNFSLIDSSYDINYELSKKSELIYPVYTILQKKLNNPFLLNEEVLENTLLDNKKGINK